MKKLWKNYKRETCKGIYDFSGGLNTNDSVLSLKPNQTPYSINTDSRTKPALCIRPARKIIPTLYSSSFGEVKYFSVLPNGEFCAICQDPSSKEYKYYNISRRILSASEPDFWSPHSVYYFDEENNQQVLIISIGQSLYYSTGAFDIFTKIDNTPSLAFLAQLDGRIYGASTFINKLYVSARGNYKLWQGNDSYTINIPGGILSECTGLFSFRDSILYFQKNAIFEIKEYKDQGFSVSNLCSGIGCISKNSITEINGNLYFLGNDGVYVYKFGSLPKMISGRINNLIKNYDLSSLKILPSSGTDGQMYYLSLVKSEKDKSVILVYDTLNDSWNAEDNPGIVNFSEKNGVLYGLSYDGVLYDICSSSNDDEEIYWSWVSPPILTSSIIGPVKQRFTKIYITANLSQNCKLNCSVITDKNHNFNLPIDLSTCKKNEDISCLSISLLNVPLTKYIQINLSGAGRCKIYSLEYSCKTINRK